MNKSWDEMNVGESNLREGAINGIFPVYGLHLRNADFPAQIFPNAQSWNIMQKMLHFPECNFERPVQVCTQLVLKNN